jgi:xanthine/uracil permease
MEGSVNVERRMLWTMAVFFSGIGTIYWFTSYEPAGTVLLFLCSGAALLSLLPLRRRTLPTTAEHGAEPAASLWPFIIGAGAVLMVDGLVLGPWLFVPGAALAGRGLVAVFGRAASSAEDRGPR